jgi:hypothetical protein
VAAAAAAAQRQQGHAAHHHRQSGQLQQTETFAQEQHRAQHGEDRRHVANGAGHCRSEPLVRAHPENGDDDGEDAAYPGEDQRRVEIEGTPVDEQDRGQPCHDQRAADRVERRAPGRHRPQPELR